MTTPRYAARARALSVSLIAVGAICAGCVVGAASPAHAAGTAPVGGRQLAGPGVIVHLAPGVPAPPTMPGASFLIADMVTGKILAAKAPHARRLPASTLKTLTALTLIPLLDAKSQIVVQPEDVRVEGSHLGILPGTAYSVRTLLQGLLMVSGNDAAYALARANHGVAVTLKAMNATAAELGAFDTVAKDPSGLDRPGQITSVYDLALIGRAAMKLPDFRRYVTTKSATLPGGRSSDGKMLTGFKIGSHNRLLYNYAGAIGIKNGYTIAAKQTFIGAASRGGKTYIVTEMASPNGSWRPMAALLDWAFAHGTSVTPIGKLVEPGTATRPKPPSAAGGLPKPLALSTAPQTPSGTVAPDTPTESALGRPAESARLPVLQPWVGAVGLLSGVALVGAFAARSITRGRR